MGYMSLPLVIFHNFNLQRIGGKRANLFVSGCNITRYRNKEIITNRNIFLED